MKRFFLAAVPALALVSMIGCAAQTGENTADSDEAVSAPTFEYSTSGGFIMYNVDVTVSSSGAVTATEKFHGGDAINMFAKLTSAEVKALKAAVPANFSQLPATIYHQHMMADGPSITISYKGQAVTLSPMGGKPVADQAFLDFSGKMSDMIYGVQQKPYVHFTTSGGFAPREIDLVVKNDGSCHLIESGIKTVDTDCVVDHALLMELHKTMEQKSGSAYAWYSLPDKCEQPPVADGVSYSMTWDGPKGAKTVDSGTAAKEPAQVAAAHDVLSRIVTSIEAAQAPAPK